MKTEMIKSEPMTDDKKCVWKEFSRDYRNRDNIIVFPECEKESGYNELCFHEYYLDKIKYCPYCGLQIEVREDD